MKKKAMAIGLLIILIQLVTVVAYAASLSNQQKNNWLWPVPASNRHMSRGYQGVSHDGIDISVGIGTPVYAAKGGTVINAFTGCNNHNGLVNGKCKDRGICSPSEGEYGWRFNGYCNNDFGNGVVIDHHDGTISQYAHMSEVLVQVGWEVSAGQKIGLSGDYGQCDGAHLHFGIGVGNYWTTVDCNPNSTSYQITAYNKTGLSTSNGYVYDYDGVQYIFEQDTTPPVITGARIVNKTSEGYDVVVTAIDDSSISLIQLATWHSGMSVDNAVWQDAVPSGGKATLHVSYSTFGNPSGVTYYSNAFAFDNHGNACEGVRCYQVANLGDDFYALLMVEGSGGYLRNSNLKITTGNLMEANEDEQINYVWHFRKQKDGEFAGSYEIVCESNGRCIDIANFGTNAGTSINLLECAATTAQRFYLLVDDRVSYPRYVLSSVYYRCALDVAGVFTEIGGTVQLWPVNFLSNQLIQIHDAEWTISYDANGGTDAPGPQFKQYQKNIVISNQIPTKSDFIFAGWSKSPSATVPQYRPGYIFSSEYSTTLYAVWREKKELKLPSSLKAIETEAFQGTSANTVHVPNNCQSIGDRAFMNSSVSSVYLPADCILGEDVFSGCNNVYLISTEGSTAQEYCNQYRNCIFIQDITCR